MTQQWAPYLKPFRLGCTPDLVKVFHPVVNGIEDDEGEESVIQGFLESLQHAVPVRVLHFWLILVFQNLRRECSTDAQVMLK